MGLSHLCGGPLFIRAGAFAASGQGPGAFISLAFGLGAAQQVRALAQAKPPFCGGPP